MKDAANLPKAQDCIFVMQSFFFETEVTMDTRIALLAVIVEDTSSVGALNALLHEYGEHIIGRMGLPYPKRGLNIVSVAVDAPQETISALSGRIGRLPGVSVKTAYAPVAQP